MSLKIGCSNYVFLNFSVKINQFWDFDSFIIAGNLLFYFGVEIIQIFTMCNLIKRWNLILALRRFINRINFIVPSWRLTHEWKPIVWITNVTDWWKVAIYTTFCKLTSFDLGASSGICHKSIGMILRIKIWVASFYWTHWGVVLAFAYFHKLAWPWFFFLNRRHLFRFCRKVLFYLS